VRTILRLSGDASDVSDAKIRCFLTGLWTMFKGGRKTFRSRRTVVKTARFDLMVYDTEMDFDNGTTKPLFVLSGWN
jgi:hypothetical protein